MPDVLVSIRQITSQRKAHNETLPTQGLFSYPKPERAKQMNNLPELKLGDKVLITFSKYGETLIRGQHEIERETKTLFIVNGQKFRKKDHQEHIARDAWSGRTEIIPADSDEALHLIQKARISKARGDFREAVNRPDKDLTELHAALEARKFLDSYIRLLGKDDR